MKKKNTEGWNSNCVTSVTRSKYERSNPSTQKWWTRMFEVMEHELKIPPEKRLEVLTQVYPRKLLERILAITESRRDLKKEIREYYPTKSTDTVFSSEGIKRFHDGESCASIVVGQFKLKGAQVVEEEEEQEDKEVDVLTIDQDEIVKSLEDEVVETKEVVKEELWDESVSSVLCKQHAPRSEDTDPERPRVIGEENPYLNFFQRKEERAAVWRILPPLSLDEMNLSQKAKYLVDQIATEFIDWLEKQGGTEKTTLNVTTLKNMFKFSFEMGHAAQSVQIKTREMPCVTEEIAKVTSNRKASERNTLLRHIKSDIEKSKLPPKQRAFGSTLPIQMQRQPNKEDLQYKWFVCKHIPPKLADMSLVWEGITNLRSVRAFSSWMDKNYPGVKHPILEGVTLDDNENDFVMH